MSSNASNDTNEKHSRRSVLLLTVAAFGGVIGVFGSITVAILKYICVPNLSPAIKGRQLAEQKKLFETQLELLKLKAERVNNARIPLAKLSDIEEGAGISFTDFALQPAILFKTGQRTCVARSAVCTHLGCTVQSSLVDGKIYCACHQSYFDLEKGTPLSGPATLPLAQEPIVIEGDIVYLVKQQTPIKVGPGQTPMLPL